jgi:hypothetical protein
LKDYCQTVNQADFKDSRNTVIQPINNQSFIEDLQIYSGYQCQ